MDHYVMDYETLPNTFLACFEHFTQPVVKVFAVCPFRNDLVAFFQFLEQNIKNKEWHISFNGLEFDGQITEHLLRNKKTLLIMDAASVAAFIYEEAQLIIQKKRNREFLRYQEKDFQIKQIDVYKLNHWDNAAKSSSLKWIQCSMDWPNVQDMPFHHTHLIQSVAELQGLAFYCRNDVSSTKAILHRSKKEVMLRLGLSSTYKLLLNSASEPKIAKELFLHFLSKKSGINKYDLRRLQTKRPYVYVKDIILPYVKFDVPEFQQLLENFKKLVINTEKIKGAFSYSIDYRGVTTDFGLGGVHGAKRGIYEADEYMTIMTSDVTSFYPNLAIRNQWAPAHLSKQLFCQQYEWFFDERKKIPKSDPRNYVYKIILNSTFGLSIDVNSFLYDPELGMRITINGQLTLMMLYTMLVENIPGAVPIMQNTDGVEIMIPRKHKDLYLQLCKQWEDLTNLQLEHDEYQKLIVPDVNNYIGIFKDKELSKADWVKAQAEYPDNLFKKKDGKYYMAKTKTKGRFEFADRALHKNKSHAVISKAIYNFFVYGIKPEEYIMSNKNIYDFCGQQRCQGNWKFEHVHVDNGKLIREPLQKTLRYYISVRGGKVFKINTADKREINLEAGRWMQTIFNLYEEKPFEQYNINYQYYLENIKKEIQALQPEIFQKNQLKFDF